MNAQFMFFALKLRFFRRLFYYPGDIVSSDTETKIVVNKIVTTR